MSPSLSSRANSFRQAISEFIAARRETKLKGLSDNDKIAEAASKYDYHLWLADAARRVAQIQAVTHVLKATHPDARGSSLYVHPERLPMRVEVGSHLLGSEFEDDIVGNAAALDVYKFLKIEVEHKRLIDWMQLNDADLLTAIHPDVSIAQEWMAAFKELIRQPENFSSHTSAKQTYWCIAGDPTQDENFHLLQNLFPSSLVHWVHQELNDARFGEVNKAARQAYNAKKSHAETYRHYPNLAVRKLGGTKPQNISQLNSERGGVNCLLSSAPPSWKTDNIKTYISANTVLDRFRSFEGVNSLINGLVRFLKTDPPKNEETRTERENYERALGEALANFGGVIREAMEPGWTCHDECKLPLHEKIWLDAKRAELPIRADYEVEDTDFIKAFEWKDWPNDMATHFAQWLNAILRKQDLPVGDAEFKHWAKQAIIETNWPATIIRKPLVENSHVELSHD